MRKHSVGIICPQCHKFTSDQPEPGVFFCKTCNAKYEEYPVRNSKVQLPGSIVTAEKP